MKTRPRLPHSLLFPTLPWLCLLGLLPEAIGATYSWNSNTAANWSTASNWSPSTGTPGASDPLASPLKFGDLRLQGPRSAASLTFNSSSAWNVVGRGSGTASASSLTVSGALTKSGSGTLTFSRGTDTTTDLTFGSLSVNAGTLSFASSLTSLTVSGAINVSSGATLTLSAANVTINTLTVNGAVNGSAIVNLQSGSVLSGTGTIANPVTVNPNDTLMPGSSTAPGKLRLTSTATFANGGSFFFNINNASAASPGNPGWSQVAVTGALTINATAVNPFAIDLKSLTTGGAAGNASNFNQTQSYTWPIITAGSIVYNTGASLAESFLIDASGFSNPLNGEFTLTQSGGTINLVYTPNSSFGIWDYSNDNNDPAPQPWSKGQWVNIEWKDLQPTRTGPWDWTTLDSALTGTGNRPSMIAFFTGTDAPSWIYTDNGGTVTPVDNPSDPQFPRYPWYDDPDYRELPNSIDGSGADSLGLLPTAIRTVRDHIRSKTYRDKIVMVQACYSTTGDYGPYKFTPPAQYDMNSTAWQAWWQTMSKFYYEEYSKTSAVNPKLVMFNPSDYGPGPANTDWLNTNAPRSMIKSGNLGHAYQLNGERDTYAWVRPAINPQTLGGSFLRARSEFAGQGVGPWWDESPAWNMYSLLLNALYIGLDYELLPKGEMNNAAYGDMYRFFNYYAGQKDVRTAPGAFCALRDGLDSEDTTRWPAGTYGTAAITNKPRYAAIAAAAGHGAAQDDQSDNQTQTGVSWRQDLLHLNDVGWNIERNNYYRYLEQIDASGRPESNSACRLDLCSQGYWRVGAPNNPPYDTNAWVTGTPSYDVPAGRFARAVNATFPEMWFQFASNFWPTRPAGGYDCYVRIVYFDNGSGTIWRLRYDGMTGSNVPGSSQITNNAGSPQWKELIVRIPDGYFGRRGDNGSDIKLVHVSGSADAIFHLIEVRRSLAGGGNPFP